MSKQQVKNEVAAPQRNVLANLPSEQQSAWGTEDVGQEEVVIPKILLMHGQSELVLDKQFATGDLIKSDPHKLLGNENQSVKVIPFSMSKSWSESEKVGGKFEWREEYPWTATNTDQAWEYEKNGTTWRRDKNYNFYALLVSELDDDTCIKPIKLQFKRTSFRAGKRIASWFSDCKLTKSPPAMKVWEIGAELIKGDENSYFVFTSKMGEDTPVDYVNSCYTWFKFIKDNADKVSDHHVEEEAATTVSEEERKF